jgi:hypothetical protein
MARISLDSPQTLGHRHLRPRMNSAPGLTAQGFRDRCELPAADEPAPAGPGRRPGPR